MIQMPLLSCFVKAFILRHSRKAPRNNTWSDLILAKQGYTWVQQQLLITVPLLCIHPTEGCKDHFRLRCKWKWRICRWFGHTNSDHYRLVCSLLPLWKETAERTDSLPAAELPGGFLLILLPLWKASQHQSSHQELLQLLSVSPSYFLSNVVWMSPLFLLLQDYLCLCICMKDTESERDWVKSESIQNLDNYVPIISKVIINNFDCQLIV